MKTKEKVAEVGIIGQMYEERKSGRVGVLESREKKYKTLMFRDKDGKSFNITYSTFRSNWRKYQGEEVVQTSTQIEEKKAEEKKVVESADKELKKKRIATTAEDKVKRVRALRTLLESNIKDSKYTLEIKPLSTGGTIVKAKGSKRTIVEVWAPSSFPDIYSFRMRKDVAEFMQTDVEQEYLEGHINCIRYRPKVDNFDAFMQDIKDCIARFIEETGLLEKNKKKNDKNDKNEKEE